MGYTTVAALSNSITPTVLARLADDSNQTADLTDAATVAVIQQAIDDASNLIDLHLYGHIDMTDGTLTGKLESVCRNLALFSLWQRQGHSNESNPMYDAFQHAILILQGLAKHKLHVADSPESPAARTISTTATTDKTFTADALEDML